MGRDLYAVARGEGRGGTGKHGFAAYGSKRGQKCFLRIGQPAG